MFSFTAEYVDGIKNLVQRGNTLQVNFAVTNYNTPFTTKISPEFLISGSAIFQVKTIAALVSNGHTNVYNNLILVRFFKASQECTLSYTINFSSKELGIAEKTFPCDDGTWHLIQENRKQQYTFDVTVVLYTVLVSSFASLHDDCDLTDFDLRGEDGSVQMHKAVLAASSQVLRRMLSGNWRENAEGRVDVPGTSKKTLQHLKDYLYLQTLPDTGLEQILVLASYYMMPDLEQKCVDKLVNSLTAENACDLLKFAAKNKETRLLLAVLDCVQSGAVGVNDIRKHFMRGK